MMKQVSRIDDIMTVFSPFPLKENEQFKEFYVNTYEARGTNAVERIAYAVRISPNTAMKILFMGHRGSGKSTELFLLKHEIEQEFDVISFFIEEEVDVDTMTYTDFIFAIMSQIVKYVDRNPQMGEFVQENIEALYKYWYEEKIFETTEHSSDEMEVDFKAKLSFLKKIVLQGGGILKAGSESKIIIRQKMEPKASYLVELLNQIISKINFQLSNKGLIFIIEDLDKISMDVASELFIKHRKVILSIKARMILSFPIYMAYDVQYNMIKEDVDMYQMLSVIKVKDLQKKEFTKGIETLKEIVAKRAVITLFTDEALHFMIMKSGGAIRDLFQMIRDASFEALVAKHSQITIQDAKVAYKNLKSEYERLIRGDEDVIKLKLIYNDPKPLTSDETMMSLLLRGLILEYNGERWCGIHPAVEDFLCEKGEISAEQI